MGKKLTKIEFSPPLEMEEGETIVVNTDPPIKIIGGNQLDRIERMLKWLVIAIQAEFQFEQMSTAQKEKLKQIAKMCPDISDILEKK